MWSGGWIALMHEIKKAFFRVFLKMA